MMLNLFLKRIKFNKTYKKVIFKLQKYKRHSQNHKIKNIHRIIIIKIILSLIRLNMFIMEIINKM